MTPKPFTDQLGRTVLLEGPPQRIVSLVPSQTELLFELGLDQEVVGITKFCVHPRHQFKQKPRIGGTKQVKIDKIRGLAPDLIIANKEENDKTQILELAREFPVWISDVRTLEEALQMIQKVGEIAGRKMEARQLAADIAAAFDPLPAPPRSPSVAYFIWRKPWMVVGKNTFIHAMLEKAGFSNHFDHLERYPEIDLSVLEKRPPEFIFLSSEPYPFREKHLNQLRERCPDTRVLLVDGELFSWYGSRLLLSAAYFRNLRAKLTLNP